MKKAVVYIHGKGGNATEAGRYESVFANRKVIGFDYRSQTPWEAKTEFPAFFERVGEECEDVILVANSIGAFFALCSLPKIKLCKAFLISPVVDMEGMIKRMLIWEGLTENDLKQRKEIPTSFGETLSWDYLSYVRKNPIEWNTPTYILYGEKDGLVPYESVCAFAEKSGAKLTVMENGEHWFHTKEQLAFLDKWLINNLK